MSRVEVRRLRADEAQEARRVRLAALLDAPDAFAMRHEQQAAEPDAYWQERARVGAAGDRIATYVAVDGDRHVGTATGVSGEREGMVWLVAMWVEPPARNAGVGAALVEAVCGWARRMGAGEVELDVREQNHSALALYRRSGFEVVAGPYPAPQAPELMELRMRRRLSPPDGPIIERLRKLPADDPVQLIERLPASDLWSLMLHATRRRSAGRTPGQLLADRRRDPTLAPVPVDGHLLHEVERLALEAADAFELVTLSPIAPGGINAVLGGLDQNLSLATVRGSEVLADPTTSLALEAALRRRAGDEAPALCAVGRVLRMQRFGGGWNQHFGLFSLVSAGRVTAGHGFALAALRSHIGVYLQLLASLRHAGLAVGRVTVEVSDSGLLAGLCRDAGVDLRELAARDRAGEAEAEALLAEAGIALPRFSREPPVDGPRGRRLGLVRSQVFEPLAARFPDAELGFRPGRLAAIGYYRGLLLNIDAELGGRRLSVADGGSTDWTQRLLSDRKERLFVSGIGVERLAVALVPA
jgi:ribosomal protein S18 acetylase RimI-like enzyme